MNKKAAVITLVAMFASAAVHAEVVLIDNATANGSFESPASGKIMFKSGNIPFWSNWAEQDSANGDTGTDGPSGGTHNGLHGTRVAFLQPGGAIVNMVTNSPHTIAEGDVISYRFRNSLVGRDPATISLVYDNGGTLTQIPGSQITAVAGSQARGTFAVQPGDGWIGSSLGVGIVSGGSWPEIDQVFLGIDIPYTEQTGLIYPYVSTERFSADVAGYFPTARLQAARDFYEIYNSTYDAAPATAPLETLLGYAAGSNQGEIYIPTSYVTNKPVGLFIYINADNNVGFINNYAQAFDDLYIIGAAPENVGNSEPDVLHFSHSLDMMTTLMQNYNIDPQRIYIGGHSGGAAVAALMSLMYPDIFDGVVCNVRSLTTGEHDFFTFEEVVSVAQQYQQRITLSTGPNDFNYQHVLNYAPVWRYRGFPVRLFDVPGMGHSMASPATFADCLAWVDYPYSSGRASTFSEWSFYQTDEVDQPSFLPDGDNDLDHFINRDEYIFATNPFDPLSKPAGVQIAVSNDVQISYVCRASLADYEVDLGVSTNLTLWDYSYLHLEDLGDSALEAGGVRRNYSPKGDEIGDAAFFKLRVQEATH